MTCLSWIWNGSVSQKKPHSQGKSRKVKNMFSEERKKKKKMEK